MFNIVETGPNGQTGCLAPISVNAPATCSGGSTGGCATNLLQNGGFENNLTAWEGGATVGATDTDYHWKTGTRFAGDYDTIPFLSAGGRADYHVTEQVSIFVAGNFDKYFHTKANVTLYDIATGVKKDGPINNGSGMDLRSFQLSGGLKVSF